MSKCNVLGSMSYLVSKYRGADCKIYGGSDCKQQGVGLREYQYISGKKKNGLVKYPNQRVNNTENCDINFHTELNM